MRRLWRWATGGLALALLLLLAAPYIAARRPFRDVVLRAMLPRVDGQVTSGGASLGWFSAIRFSDVEIRTDEGVPVVTLRRLQGDRPLWRLLLDSSDLGHFRVERPRLDVVVTDESSNLAEVFGGAEDERPRSALATDASLSLEIVEGSLRFRSPHADVPWGMEGLNLSLALQPGVKSRSGLSELVVRRGTVFDHAPITPRMCDDLLKYIAPVLAEATDVSGEFSIHLDQWRFPLERPRQAEGSGRLVIHSIDVGSGPLVRALAPLVGLPPSLRLADSSQVEFSMADGRVHHQGLQFGVRELNVRTNGSVGLDQSLDLVAELAVPPALLRGTAVGEMLAGQTIRLPIGGTLRRPKIDPKALGASNLDLLLETLGQWLKRRSPDGRPGLERLLDPQRDKPLLDRLRQWRQHRRDTRP